MRKDNFAPASKHPFQTPCNVSFFQKLPSHFNGKEHETNKRGNPPTISFQIKNVVNPIIRDDEK